ncbi:MAG TPA: hypothetical protein VKU02_07745 [Gemmataceae bacterium]|nr:hypothetical protein [Gemmataceae bacterium]
MRRISWLLAAGMWLALAWGGATAGSPIADGKHVSGGTCGKFGTTVEFVSTPSEAARQAKREQKLVFVLHVSGHFEDPRFT